MTRKIYHIIESIALFFWHLLFKIIGKEASEEGDRNFIQFVRFGLVGLSNTVVSYAIYTVTLLIFRAFGLFPGIDYYIATVVSFILSVAWSFYWNNRFVFKQGEDGRSMFGSLLKCYASYSITGLGVNNLLLFLWVNVLGISAFLGPLLSLIITVPLNYILNKFWAFK